MQAEMPAGIQAGNANDLERGMQAGMQAGNANDPVKGRERKAEEWKAVVTAVSAAEMETELGIGVEIKNVIARAIMTEGQSDPGMWIGLVNVSGHATETEIDGTA
jgi:hypothetical protein